MIVKYDPQEPDRIPGFRVLSCMMLDKTQSQKEGARIKQGYGIAKGIFIFPSRTSPLYPGEEITHP